MRLFLDTSVLLAATGSACGAAREIFRLAPRNRWVLLASPYVLEEVLRNLSELPQGAGSAWIQLRQDLVIMDDILTLDRPAVFAAGKDRPVLFSALAWSDVLITHDRKDFGDRIGAEFYGLAVLTPGMFLGRERRAGRLR